MALYVFYGASLSQSQRLEAAKINFQSQNALAYYADDSRKENARWVFKFYIFNFFFSKISSLLLSICRPFSFQSLSLSLTFSLSYFLSLSLSLSLSFFLSLSFTPNFSIYLVLGSTC